MSRLIGHRKTRARPPQSTIPGLTNRLVLIVEDERHIAEALAYNLEQAGLRTLTASDGAHGLAAAQKALPALILLDWMLPTLDGIEVCRLLKRDRRTARIPIIMLTVKSDETEKVVALEMGADDYVTKPFGPRELMARVKTILRRATTDAAPKEQVMFDGLRIEWAKHVVMFRGKSVPLTWKEFQLLKALIEAQGRVLSRTYLLQTVWEYGPAVIPQTHTVAFHVSQLRKKLQPIARRIVTLKRAGYRFVLEEGELSAQGAGKLT